jgi:glucosamine--fructose-6-phosphate aminotransferase (isomerizing)
VLFEKTLSNCQEAKARDAQLIGFSSVGEHEAYASVFDSVHPFVATHEVLSPLVSIVPLQLLAYHIAEHLGKDVDQPRNLAKSVTVE